jgi:hypothetical protein
MTQQNKIYGAYVPSDFTCPYLVVRYKVAMKKHSSINLALMERTARIEEHSLNSCHTESNFLAEEQPSVQSNDSDLSDVDRAAEGRKCVNHHIFRDINGFEECTHLTTDIHEVRNMNGMVFFIADVLKREYLILKADFGE